MVVADLLLTENAYFYRKKEELQRQTIDEIFDNVLSEKSATSTVFRIVRKTSVVNGFRVSCIVFGFDELPSFITSVTDTSLAESRFGYLLLLNSLA